MTGPRLRNSLLALPSPSLGKATLFCQLPLNEGQSDIVSKPIECAQSSPLGTAETSGYPQRDSRYAMKTTATESVRIRRELADRRTRGVRAVRRSVLLRVTQASFSLLHSPQMAST
jgi:hypothetical protein